MILTIIKEKQIVFQRSIKDENEWDEEYENEINKELEEYINDTLVSRKEIYSKGITLLGSFEEDMDDNVIEIELEIK